MLNEKVGYKRGGAWDKNERQETEPWWRHEHARRFKNMPPIHQAWQNRGHIMKTICLQHTRHFCIPINLHCRSKWQLEISYCCNIWFWRTFHQWRGESAFTATLRSVCQPLTLIVLSASRYSLLNLLGQSTNRSTDHIQHKKWLKICISRSGTCSCLINVLLCASA